MDRHQAAQFLGVSVSTLDRLASQGRLTRGRARGKTRPRTDYDAEELQRLKSELESAGRGGAAAPAIAPGPQDSVGFRLDSYYVSRLKAEGERLGMSAGEYARKLVIQGLEQDRDALLQREFAALRKQLDAQKPVPPTPPAPALDPSQQLQVQQQAQLQLHRQAQRQEELQQELHQELSALRESLTSMFYLVLVTRLGASEEEATEILQRLTRKG